MLGQIVRFALILSLGILIGCSDESAPPLRVGTNVWPGYEPLYLAREMGYLKDGDVHLVEYSNSSQVIQAFRNGLVDAAGLTLDEVLLLAERGETPTIVLVMDISNGGDAIIGQPNVTLLSDIKGKRVGVEGNALGAYMLTRALESAGLDRKAISVIQLSADEHEKAFQEKRVDAVVTFDPASSKLMTAGGNLLFDSRQLPGEIVDVLVVRKEFLNSHPDTVKILVDAWYHALDAIKANPRQTAESLGRRMKLNVDETLAAFNGITLPNTQESQRLLTSQPEPPLEKSAKKLAKLMLEQGLVSKPVDVARLFSSAGKDLKSKTAD